MFDGSWDMGLKDQNALPEYPVSAVINAMVLFDDFKMSLVGESHSLFWLLRQGDQNSMISFSFSSVIRSMCFMESSVIFWTSSWAL